MSRIKRNKYLQIALSQMELEMIRSRASQAGVSCSELLRRNALLRPLPKLVSKVTVDAYAELSRIGKNINQLTRATNAAIKMGVPPPAATSEIEELIKLLHHLQREIALVGENSLVDSEDDDDWEDNDCEAD